MPADTGSQGPSHPFFATVYDPALALLERTLLRPHREYLVAGLEGSVLDLGAGTGAMVPYFAAVEDVTTVHAVEPDPHMRRRAAARARTHGLDVAISDAPAESLPYPADTFDAVVASMVFCTIPDVDAAVSEVARILEPGGELRFFEHVADDGWRGRIQEVLAPLWERVAGGCQLTRCTASRLAAEPTFETVEIERLQLGVTPIRPFVRGTLRKRT